MAAESGPSPARSRPGRFRTVRVRITLVATAVSAVALVAGAFVLVSMLSSRLTDTVRSGAQTHADEVATALSNSGLASLRLADDDDRLVQVLDSNDAVIRSSTPEIAGSPMSAVSPGNSTTIRVAFDDDDYLAVATVVDTDQGRYTVVTAHALDQVAESRRALATLLAAGVPILLLLLVVTTWRVVGGALAPVEAIRREVDEVSAVELHRRVPQPAGDDEIARLAATMNRMLSRLEASRVRQQQFVSDASHELRSPIASLRAHAEVASAHPDRVSTPQLAETVLAESLRVQQLVENLLVLARADEQHPTPRHEPVDLDDLVFSEAQRVRSRSGVALDTSRVSAGRVRGDASLLRRVIGNLLDNAVRHADSRVEVGLREEGESVHLRVDDDGRGVPSGDRELVFARFFRLDDARASDDGGAGLGLAIVAEVVSAHSGTVGLSESSSGGARFDIRLPRSVE